MAGAVQGAGKAPHQGTGEKRPGKAKATHLFQGPLRSGVPAERGGQAGGEAQRPEQPGSDPRHRVPRLAQRRGCAGAVPAEAARREGEGRRRLRQELPAGAAALPVCVADPCEPSPSPQHVSSARQGLLRPQPPPRSLLPPAGGQALVIPTVGKAGACGFALKAGFVLRGAAPAAARAPRDLPAPGSAGGSGRWEQPGSAGSRRELGARAAEGCGCRDLRIREGG